MLLTFKCCIAQVDIDSFVKFFMETRKLPNSFQRRLLNIITATYASIGFAIAMNISSQQVNWLLSTEMIRDQWHEHQQAGEAYAIHRNLISSSTGIKNPAKSKDSRARFWSSDLWVMGPARSHCATLLLIG